MSIRLNKLLARRGLGARRKCDALIQSGVVRVNGQVVVEPGTMVEPERDRVEVRNRPLPPAAEMRYFVLHKPVGVISTLHDPEGRRTIRDLLPPGPRLFPVGRLDADTSGLLVLTNDGELAHRLMHPRYGVMKSYRVRLAHVPSAAQLQRLGTGVEFEPGVVSAPARVWVVDATPDRAMLSLVIHEGRYRQVRRMCEAVGLTVLGLHRSAYGPLHLGELTRGMWRELSEGEVASLHAAAARPAAHARQGARYLGVPRGEAAARRAASGPRPAATVAAPGRSKSPEARLRARPGSDMRPPGPEPRVRAARPTAGRRVRPLETGGRGQRRPARPIDYRKRGAVRPSRPVVGGRRGAARPGRTRRPVDNRQRGAAWAAQPPDGRRSRPARAKGGRWQGTARLASDRRPARSARPPRPEGGRRRTPIRSERSSPGRKRGPARSTRPAGERQRAPARSARTAGERRGPPARFARPAGERQPAPARSARPAGPRRAGSGRLARAGDMARPGGRGGAIFRSRRPPERPGRRRSR